MLDHEWQQVCPATTPHTKQKKYLEADVSKINQKADQKLQSAVDEFHQTIGILESAEAQMIGLTSSSWANSNALSPPHKTQKSWPEGSKKDKLP